MVESVEVRRETPQGVEVAGQVDDPSLQHLHHRDIRHDAGAGEMSEVDDGVAAESRLVPQPRQLRQFLVRKKSEEIENFLRSRAQSGVHSNKAVVGSRLVDGGEVGGVLPSSAPDPAVGAEVIVFITERMDVKTVVVSPGKKKIIYIVGGILCSKQPDI